MTVYKALSVLKRIVSIYITSGSIYKESINHEFKGVNNYNPEFTCYFIKIYLKRVFGDLNIDIESNNHMGRITLQCNNHMPINIIFTKKELVLMMYELLSVPLMIHITSSINYVETDERNEKILTSLYKDNIAISSGQLDNIKSILRVYKYTLLSIHKQSFCTMGDNDNIGPHVEKYESPNRYITATIYRYDHASYIEIKLPVGGVEKILIVSCLYDLCRVFATISNDNWQSFISYSGLYDKKTCIT